MEIMNFRFNTKSFTLLFFNIIILPIAITQIFRAYDEMNYYKNFVKAIHLYNSENLDQAKYYLLEALDIKEGDINATLLLGTIEFLEGDYEKAKQNFIYVKEFSFGAEGASGSLGEYVCDMQLLAKNTKKIDNAIVYRDIESKITVLVQNNQDFVDGYIAKGHIFLLQGKFYRHNNDQEKERDSFLQAKAAFRDAQRKIDELISTGNMDYYGPSNVSCHSLYQGLGELNYWESQQFLKLNPKPEVDSPEALEVYKLTSQAIENYQRAFLYSIKAGKLTAQNINYCYGTLLNYPWLNEDQRKSTLAKAEAYIKHMEKFRIHVDILYGSNLKGQSEWQIQQSTGYIHAGMGASHFHIKDFANSKRDYSNAIREKVPGTQNMRNFISLYSVNKGHETRDIGIEICNAISRGYEKNIENNIFPEYKETKTITENQFVIINNYLVACYYGRARNPKHIDEIIALMPVFESMKFDLPDDGWLNGNKIIGNNLFFLAKEIKSIDARPWKQYVID